ncbi:class I adenylate-forming enzyme family protein [Arthrobacter sp. NyZ413]|uniref:class I adenylate-forming enzyme family protein n=1 Tax=Arthrobacter sp. NyZ413 TaxID=3144669 RepID=UPI003BF7FEF3
MARYVQAGTMMGRTFSDTLRGRAREDSYRTAILDHDITVTYRDLDAATDALAAKLIDSGVQRGDRVLLMADNSAAHLAAAFGVWRVGAVLTTLYASSSTAEIAYALSHSEASLILADQRSQGAIGGAAHGLPILTVSNDDFRGVPARTESLLPVEVDVDPEALALICYTSGSTAAPKAVMHSHAGLQGAAESYASVWHLGPADRTVVCLPMAWAFGLVTTSMATMVAGGTVIVLSRTKPELILDALNRLRGTFLAGVTTMFVKLVDHLAERGTLPLPDLRLCISGGEPRNEHAFARWVDLTGCPVHDVYAASECFPAVTYDPYEDPLPVPGSSGKVAPGSQMKVLDPDGKEVDPGATGEALWKGPAQLLGYWKNPEQTRKALTDDGWYRTGDLVRVDSRGYVFVVGRLSDMIIRGGSNISPAEVEAVLTSHPSVRSAAVVGLPDEKYGELVAAALVMQRGLSMDADEMKGFCAARLAGYKVPGTFVAVESLPVNSRTGKVDRKQLKVELQTTGAAA